MRERQGEVSKEIRALIAERTGSEPPDRLRSWLRGFLAAGPDDAVARYARQKVAEALGVSLRGQ